MPKRGVEEESSRCSQVSVLPGKRQSRSSDRGPRHRWGAAKEPSAFAFVVVPPVPRLRASRRDSPVKKARRPTTDKAEPLPCTDLHPAPEAQTCRSPCCSTLPLRLRPLRLCLPAQDLEETSSQHRAMLRLSRGVTGEARRPPAARSARPSDRAEKRRRASGAHARHASGSRLATSARAHRGDHGERRIPRRVPGFSHTAVRIVLTHRQAPIWGTRPAPQGGGAQSGAIEGRTKVIAPNRIARSREA